MNGIEIKNVTKYFHRKCALDQVNLFFEENKIYGLLGRNGAGKSTLLNIMTNRIFADSGEVIVDGEALDNNDRALNKLYLINDKNYFPENMKIKAIYEWTKSFYPDFDEEYAKHLSECFELNTKKTVRSLSTGYTSIFKLIIALSVNTPYVFLDEPVLGLDANHRDLFYRTLINKYSEKPSTFIISTHLIEEAASVIEDIVILKKGRVIMESPCEELLAGAYIVSGNTRVVDAYIANKNLLGIDTLGGLKTAYLLGAPEINIPTNLEVSKPDLQKLFIQLTN